MRKEIQTLEAADIIVPSCSSWCSPVDQVRKPDWSVLMCVNYCKVNAVTHPDPFYMPTLNKVIAGVGRSCVASRLEMTKGYYQVVVAPEN